MAKDKKSAKEDAGKSHKEKKSKKERKDKQAEMPKAGGAPYDQQQQMQMMAMSGMHGMQNMGGMHGMHGMGGMPRMPGMPNMAMMMGMNPMTMQRPNHMMAQPRMMMQPQVPQTVAAALAPRRVATKSKPRPPWEGNASRPDVPALANRPASISSSSSSSSSSPARQRPAAAAPASGQLRPLLPEYGQMLRPPGHIEPMFAARPGEPGLASLELGQISVAPRTPPDSSDVPVPPPLSLQAPGVRLAPRPLDDVLLGAQLPGQMAPPSGLLRSPPDCSPGIASPETEVVPLKPKVPKKQISFNLGGAKEVLASAHAHLKIQEQLAAVRARRKNSVDASTQTVRDPEVREAQLQSPEFPTWCGQQDVVIWRLRRRGMESFPHFPRQGKKKAREAKICAAVDEAGDKSDDAIAEAVGVKRSQDNHRRSRKSVRLNDPEQISESPDRVDAEAPKVAPEPDTAPAVIIDIGDTQSQGVAESPRIAVAADPYSIMEPDASQDADLGLGEALARELGRSMADQSPALSPAAEPPAPPVAATA